MDLYRVHGRLFHSLSSLHKGQPIKKNQLYLLYDRANPCSKPIESHYTEISEENRIPRLDVCITMHGPNYYSIPFLVHRCSLSSRFYQWQWWMVSSSTHVHDFSVLYIFLCVPIIKLFCTCA